MRSLGTSLTSTLNSSLPPPLQNPYNMYAQQLSETATPFSSAPSTPTTYHQAFQSTTNTQSSSIYPSCVPSSGLYPTPHSAAAPTHYPALNTSFSTHYGALTPSAYASGACQYDLGEAAAPLCPPGSLGALGTPGYGFTHS